MAANPVIRISRTRLESNANLSETTIVRARGRITSSTSAALERTLVNLIPQFKRIVLDVSNVDHIDSFGMAALMSVYMQARKTECNLEMANSRPCLRDRLRSWLESVFKDHEEFLGLTPD
jgi:anti-anti-sigma factor